MPASPFPIYLSQWRQVQSFNEPVARKVRRTSLNLCRLKTSSHLLVKPKTAQCLAKHDSGEKPICLQDETPGSIFISWLRWIQAWRMISPVTATSNPKGTEQRSPKTKRGDWERQPSVLRIHRFQVLRPIKTAEAMMSTLLVIRSKDRIVLCS